MKKPYDRKYRSYRKKHARGGQKANVAELVSLMTAAKMQDDEAMKNLVRVIHLTRDDKLAHNATEYLQMRALEQTLNNDPFASPVDAEQATGDLILGRIRNSVLPFGLFLAELCQHVLVIGRSGAGKTTLIFRLLKQLLSLTLNAALAVRILVFDIKRDYQKLRLLFPEIWCFKLPGKDFRWNPLEPPIRDWQQWAGILAASFANSVGFYGGMGTENLIYKYILQLYHKYDMKRGVYPCLFDLLDYLQMLKADKKIDRYSEEYRWYIRLLNRVENLCNAFGETVTCSRGYPLAELLAHHTIFDLAGLKPDAQTFFTETFLAQVLWHRIENEERGGTLRTLGVFDEAKRLMPRYREESQQAVSNMSHMVAMGREYGIGFVVAECDPSLLANSIKSSCYTRCCFNQTNGRDIRDSVEALDLDPDQAAEIQKLEVGETVVRIAGRIKEPFVLQVTP